MVARPLRCDPSLLRTLLEDRLGEEEQAALAAHLEACDDCRLGLERMAAESRWGGDVRLLAGQTSDTPPDRPDPRDEDGRRLGFLGPPTGPGQLGTLGPYEV